MIPIQILEELIICSKPIIGEGFQFYSVNGKSVFECISKEGEVLDYKLCYLIPKEIVNSNRIPYYCIQFQDLLTDKKEVFQVIKESVKHFVEMLMSNGYRVKTFDSIEGNLDNTNKIIAPSDQK